MMEVVIVDDGNRLTVYELVERVMCPLHLHLTLRTSAAILILMMLEPIMC